MKRVITLIMVSLIRGLPTMQWSSEESVMDIRWKFIFYRLLIWVVAEVVFSMLGVDDLADYSEFLLERSTHVLAVQEIAVK